MTFMPLNERVNIPVIRWISKSTLFKLYFMYKSHVFILMVMIWRQKAKNPG